LAQAQLWLSRWNWLCLWVFIETMLRVLSVLSLAMPFSKAMELTKETWDEAVAGKTVFVKLLAPW